MRGVIALLALVILGCGGFPLSSESPPADPLAIPVEETDEVEPEVPEADPDVVKAAVVANAIADGTDPGEAMADQGFDEASFEALLFEIAADPARSEAYRAERQ